MAEGLPECYLADHGEYYGMDLTDGRIFAPSGSKEERILAEISPGTLFFSLSERGISAIGIAGREAVPTPVPAWRYRYAKPGERGLSLPLTVILLRVPMSRKELSGILPFPHSGTTGDPGIRLIPVGAGAADRILDAVFLEHPELRKFVGYSAVSG